MASNPNPFSWKGGDTQSSRTMGVSLRVDDADLKDFLRVMNSMGKEANTQLKKEVEKISWMTATALRFSASSKRQKIIANTIKAKYDRMPTISIGGSKKITAYDRNGGTVGDMLYGVEFGARRGYLDNGGRSFPTRSYPTASGGNNGWWIFPTLRKMQPEIRRRWYQAVDELIDQWSN
jgi:hypothetical protein